MHPWETVSLEDYEAHMSLAQVHQMQTLSEIMKSQLDDYPVQSVAILGISGGNGLEHVDTGKIKTVYGIDVNESYLDACRERFAHLGECLCLQRADLSDPNEHLPTVDLVIADLFIEYIGVEVFARQLANRMPGHVSCVIQKSLGAEFVSQSPYTASFERIGTLHRDIDESTLTAAMRRIGMLPAHREEFGLPNAKQFIRLDYSEQGVKRNA
ncbi:MAG: class I SAM-dependent methyltransferase [Acetanaerobacterium sp.]